MNQHPSQIIIMHLIFLLRTYKGVDKLIVATKNRNKALNPDISKHADLIQGLKSQKDKIKRKIEKELVHWPVWSFWMQRLRGIGPWIAGNLIISFYYKLQPICKECGGDLMKKSEDDDYKCQECGKKPKGDGNLQYRLEYRDFPTISKWWRYMGRDPSNNKRKKGEQSRFSVSGKTVGFHIAEEFEKQAIDHPYKAYMNERKKYREKTHPDKKAQQRFYARNETTKLFLSHFWVVAREVYGLPTENPYIIGREGHEHMIAPYLWEPN